MLKETTQNILSAEMFSGLNVKNWSNDEVVWWKGNWTNGKQIIGIHHNEKMER